MKLNNKGFAITSLLYGLLILFVILVGSYLLVLTAKKDRIDTIVNEIESGYVGTMRTIVSHIEKLYYTAGKVIITKDGIEYNYALSVNLMNDRLGGTTSDYDGGNIRYYGENPNNYIYYNCSDYANQSATTCEKWRIIGIFGKYIKILKEDDANMFSWNEVNATYDDFQTINLDYYTYIKNTGNGTIDNPYQIYREGDNYE